MNRNKSLLYIIIAISVILCIPSVCYLINNQTVDGFNAYYTYTLTNHTNKIIGLLSGIIIIGLLLIFSIFYIKLIKQENQIFKNPKQTIIFIMIVSFLFMIILPYLSSDIYYYIGDSWLSSKYQENPYYTAVSDLQEKGINDEILANTGVWKSTTSVYGPLWNTIARILVSFSFGKVTIALFIFKIAAYLVHILNCYIIKKIKNSKLLINNFLKDIFEKFNLENIIIDNDFYAEYTVKENIDYIENLKLKNGVIRADKELAEVEYRIAVNKQKYKKLVKENPFVRDIQNEFIKWKKSKWIYSFSNIEEFFQL